MQRMQSSLEEALQWRASQEAARKAADSAPSEEEPQPDANRAEAESQSSELQTSLEKARLELAETCEKAARQSSELESLRGVVDGLQNSISSAQEAQEHDKQQVASAKAESEIVARKASRCGAAAAVYYYRAGSAPPKHRSCLDHCPGI